MAYRRRLKSNEEDFNITAIYIRMKPLPGQDRSQKLPRDDILDHFSTFGDVKSVCLRNKPKRSYGFVKFTQPESAAKALQTKIHTIATHRVEINVADERYQNWTDRLLDLNDDCLLEIFSAKCLSVWDLCSLAETSGRLKELTGVVFRRKWKNCNINTLLPQTHKRDAREVERVLINFGSMLSELEIDANKFRADKRTGILDCVTRYCSDTLDSLILEGFNVPDSIVDKLQPIFSHLQKIKITRCRFEGARKKFFAHCAALVNLAVCYSGDFAFISKKTFPKLRHFEYVTDHGGVEVNFASFLSRHKFLVDIKLSRAIVNSKFLKILPKLKELKVLELWSCRGIHNLNQLDDMNQLTKLVIRRVDEVVVTDLVRFIQRLENLIYLVVELEEWYTKLDKEAYLKIVKIIGNRSNKSKLFIRLYTPCYSGTDDQHSDVFFDNKHIVEVRTGCYCGEDNHSP